VSDHFDGYAGFARRAARTRHKMARMAARNLRLCPAHWQPQLVQRSWPQPDPVQLVYRAANRPYRRAFRGIVHGELGRKILLAVGVNARAAIEGYMLHPTLPAATWRDGADG
jgi:hypothetical protein